MNTITHEGNEYEVLSLDRISEITHARLAGRKVVKSEEFDCDVITLCSPSGYVSTRFGLEELEPFGIQPLKLLERKPVEFVIKVGTNGLGDAQINERPPQSAIGKKFRCVEIVEVTK